MRAHMHACVHTFLSACHTHSQCLRANDRAPTPCTTPKYLAATAHTLPRNLPPYRPPNTKKKTCTSSLLICASSSSFRRKASCFSSRMTSCRISSRSRPVIRSDRHYGSVTSSSPTTVSTLAPTPTPTPAPPTNTRTPTTTTPPPPPTLTATTTLTTTAALLSSYYYHSVSTVSTTLNTTTTSQLSLPTTATF